jgi:hypothetical protein
MKETFSLTPFSSSELDLKITGTIERRDRHLAVRYDLVGNLSEVVLPLEVGEERSAADFPKRKHELWKTTCFEFFLGVKHSDRYWEFNLSPAGHWNVYRFEGYRYGMEEETALTTLPFKVEHQPEMLSLALDCDLSSIDALPFSNQMAPSDRALEVAITAVIESKSGEITYWALTHPGAEADFHRRDSFIIEL